MSGHIPDFIKKGAKVLLDKKEEVVSDYFFTSGPAGMHNSDQLVILFKSGKEVDFDYDRVKPIGPVRPAKLPTRKQKSPRP